MRLLRASPDVASARVLGATELSDMLRPWLGVVTNSAAIALPSVIEVHLAEGADPTAIGAELERAAPGTMTESHGIWVGRLAVLARSLQACAWLILLTVVVVSTCVVMVATRAGLAARREAIETVHGLGATDGYIAGRFARRVTRLAALGGLIGALAALPVLVAMARLAQPFLSGDNVSPSGMLRAALPLWVALPALPIAAGLIGWITAQSTVRRWLRKLP